MGDFIPTLGSKNKKNAPESFEVYTYRDPRKQSKPSGSFSQKPRSNVDNESDDAKDNEVDQQKLLKKFRHDVMKLSMNGLEKGKAHKAKVALAISLGAKPPKNKKKNYKKLIEERKKEKNKEAKLNKFSSGFSSSQLCRSMELKNKAKNKSKKQKKLKGVLGDYGVVTKNKS